MRLIAPLLAHRRVLAFWFAVTLTGVGAGLGAAALTGLLELTQSLMWGGGGWICCRPPRAPRRCTICWCCSVREC